MANENPSLTVLLHESQQVSESIERLQATSNALFGAVLPAAGAILLFAAKTEEIRFPVEYLGLLFAAIVTLALVYNAGLWLELSRYTRYKYLVIFPALYAEAGFNQKESLGHFLAQEHIKAPDWLALLFQAIALAITAVICLISMCSHPLLLALAGIFLLTAILTDVWVARRVIAAFAELANASPVQGTSRSNA